jgi:protein-tyrosine phosphatase
MPHAAPTVPLHEGSRASTHAAELAAALASGRVVGLPRETVYALAVRGDDPAARAELLRLVGDPDARPTWQVTGADALAGWSGFGVRARRLVQRYWPGPLALVLPGAPPAHPHLAQSGWTAVRAPAHEGARAVLAACAFPVIALDAKGAAGEPLLEAADVARRFGAGLAALGDGGRCRLGEASSVLAIGSGRFEVLHTGILSRADLAATSGRRIAFVCTGNTCRSPMALALARRLVSERLGLPSRDGAGLEQVGFELASFGVAAQPGARASANAVTAMKERGLDLGGHRSHQAIPEELARFDEILGLTRGHVAAITAALPPRLAERVELLDPRGRDVPDPIGGSLDDYKACAAAIEEALVLRVAHWA